MHNPVPSVLPFEEGSNIAEAAGGVKSLVRSPLVVTETDSNAWEGYNYKPSPKVTGCGSGGPANW